MAKNDHDDIDSWRPDETDPPRDRLLVCEWQVARLQSHVKSERGNRDRRSKELNEKIDGLKREIMECIKEIQKDLKEYERWRRSMERYIGIAMGAWLIGEIVINTWVKK